MNGRQNMGRIGFRSRKTVAGAVVAIVGLLGLSTVGTVSYTHLTLPTT